MAKIITLPNGKCDLKFGSLPTNFKKVEKFNYKRNFFKIYIDKNGSVWDIKRIEVVSWRGKKPDEVKEVRDLHLFNKIKGNPAKIAINKIVAEIDAAELFS